MIRKIALIAAGTLALGLGAAAAQDYTLPATYGDIKLATGFLPDPHVTTLDAGGPINVANTVGGDCRGFVAEAPDLRLFYTAGTAPLMVFVEAEGDTTLLINDPNGDWHCDDDSGRGLNAAITFETPLAGQYDIWVGTYAETGLTEAILNISETAVIVAELDYNLPPIFGEATLNAGFAPDPQAIAVDASGEVDVSVMDEACYGYATAAPTYRIQYTAGTFPLFIYAQTNGDAVLIVNDPQGNWHCDDDAGGSLNPSVTFDAPLAGQYDIWVGTYGQGDFLTGTLYVSEIGGTTEGGGGGLDWELPSIFGEVTLTAGFTPDPFSVAVDAGGPVEANQVDDTCRGYVTSAPTYRLFYTPGTFPLIFSVLSDGDTTMAIADPAGDWFCDDDGGDGLNPLITFDNPIAGQYDIWVGTYGEGATIAATLEISERGGGEPPATGALDVTLTPLNGEITLAAGFTPDPRSIDLTAGGAINATAAVNDTCRGYVDAAPHVRLFYTAGGFPLAIWVESLADTTLVINDPNGEWICDDDAGDGLNPAIFLQNAPTGQYDIWVGTYSQQQATAATLFISEVTNPIEGAVGPGSIPPPPSLPPPVSVPPVPPSGAAGQLDFNLPPVFGEVTLAAGFTPDPNTVFLDAGGPVPAETADAACRGFVSSAPSVRLFYTAAAWPLILSVMSEADTTLVVNTPNGEWICNDDGPTDLNPKVQIDQPLSGQYDIWVGTYGGGALQAATLFISEIGAGP